MKAPRHAAETGPVRRRKLFYIPGYDPFPPRRYRELYRSQAALQAELSGHDIALAPKAGGGYGWLIEAEVEGRDVSAEVEVLVWSDLVKASMGQGIVETYRQLFRTSWLYVGSGALRRLMRLRKGPMIAALYPIAALILQLLAALAVGLAAAHFLPVGGLPGGLLGLIIVAGSVWGGLWLFRRHDRRIYAWYLMHDYAFTTVEDGAYPAALEARIADFRTRIAADLARDWDEVLVVGHSSGAYLAISILADLIRREPVQPDGPALSLLTLGQVVPMVSFLPGAGRLREDLAYLSERPELAWVDVTAPGDGCAFALCDPVAVSGMAGPAQRWPLVLSAAFSRTLSPVRWQRLKRRYFRLHFQYLCAFDNLTGAPDEYDYFAVTAGPKTLWQRFGGRAPSKSRVVEPQNPYGAFR
ncbi:hypothetical protein [Frigidibacter sp. SD6-1]|uniref:hypothetical protein n=1 Tax=Frigidibacter sp. SD6-1 TaxID=3032581 RepID=UPI0024DFA49C|nr:hypothetical protein [Frigidibacter sp. SD6-1]